MKKVILAAFIALACTNGYSQKKGGFRVGLDLGYTVPSNGGGGLLFSIEPKYNIQENMNIGLRIGAAAMIRDIQDNGTTTSAKVSANGSYVGTYDYYFNKSGKSFVPYIGAGAGYYSIANVEFDDVDNTSNQVSVSATGKMGALLRGGFEWGKFRMGVEYNLVPKSDLQNLNGDKVGTVSNTYLGIHLGFYVGGGKWRK
jgi:outer membrane protein W